MGNKGRILVVGFVLILLALFAWQVMRPREPIYEGKSLSVWLEAYYPTTNQVSDSFEQFKANGAIKHAGTNAIPILLKMMRFKNRPLQDNIAFRLKALGLSRVGYVHSSVKYVAAAMAFKCLGPQAKEAVPELIKIYDENLSGLSQSLVAQILGDIGPASQETIPTLIRMLKNPSASVRNSAIVALARIHQEPETVVPVLIKAVDDPDRMVRHAAVGALESFGGRRAKAAIPKLLELRKSDDSTLSDRAERLLRKMDPAAVREAETKMDKSNLKAADVDH
ncbi:HEAT repeat domain-containing protein [Pedosphaera parvula]|uniref:PBS lyase HEAT domain protein repeat-containing protein n=1 Tax=Pedosphaera parvula (strain Ellin514) TaxID=320771 RepID=B9XEE7_PEDPL|nr:HEAT repeat domain-containing protein [Pedosphaera parvula]EEF61661.1 PBS lyase HEAT domain protein repeat-containing protein [Pedosphaera parvula Ellin514]